MSFETVSPTEPGLLRFVLKLLNNRHRLGGSLALQVEILWVEQMPRM